MGNLVIVATMIALGIGGLVIVTSLVFLLVSMFVSDSIRQRTILIIAGKFLLAGILLFAVGFGSCVILLSY